MITLCFNYDGQQQSNLIKFLHTLLGVGTPNNLKSVGKHFLNLKFVYTVTVPTYTEVSVGKRFIYPQNSFNCVKTFFPDNQNVGQLGPSANSAPRNLGHFVDFKLKCV
jgi:hypothetical protein